MRLRSLFIVLFLIFTSHTFASADTLEEARVIKIDKVLHDTIVQRQDGSQWLLQHGRTCTSMSTEWPIQLILDAKEKIIKVKVNFNEFCLVYAATPLDAEIPVDKYLSSDNALVPDHQFETRDQGQAYRLDYGTACKYFREFKTAGSKVYLVRHGRTIASGESEIYLPGNRGHCRVERVETLGVANATVVDTPTKTAEFKMGQIQYQAQNNQVYFYWDDLPAGQVDYYAYGYSRFSTDPSTYTLKQLPNFGKTKDHKVTITNLANKRLYYFFFAPVNAAGKAGEWTTLAITPINPDPTIKNNPDYEPFDVTVAKEDEATFTMKWPKKANVLKYRIQFFVDGKLQWLKDISPQQTSFTITKRPEYKKKGLRFHVSTLPIDRLGLTYSDGIYWIYKLKK